MLIADRGYDHDTYRRRLHQRGIRPAIAERGQPRGTAPPGHLPPVVERAISCLCGFGRLHLRWERRADHEALGLTVCLIPTAAPEGRVRTAKPERYSAVIVRHLRCGY